MNIRSCLAILLALVPGRALSQGAPGSFQNPAWKDYQVIMWIGDSAWKKPEKVPLFFQRLREMGVNCGMVHGQADAKPFLENKFPYYLENMVNKGLCLKWNSNVKDWDAFVTNWTKTGRKPEAFVRDYCLEDPEWRKSALDQMGKLAGQHKANAPLLYDIRDELSTTISANPFDYDFSPASLAAFRLWLKQHYPDVAALNAKWETKFANWEAVMPFSTDQIKNRMSGGGAQPRGNPDWQALAATKLTPDMFKDRTRWNFSPWADFRSFMDSSLAGVLNALRQKSHSVDSKTPVGIEGTQMPHAFGGYDLWKLSQALDWVEPYDICNARDIFGSFMPHGIFLTTVGEQKSREASRRLWHLLLEGDAGCIIWWSEDCIDWNSPDYALTKRARDLAPVFKELRSPAADTVRQAQRKFDPVWIYHSQPSIQMGWLVESTVDGSTWHRRFSSYESTHNRMAKVRDAWLKAVQDIGLSPRFLAPQQFLGDWRPAAGTVLILPQCLALSDQEITALQKAKAAGVKILTNGFAGVFDEHGCLRDKAPFPALDGVGEFAAADLSGSAGFSQDVTTYLTDRLTDKPAAFTAWLRPFLPAAPLTVAAEARLRQYHYQVGKNRLLALERGVSYAMSESLAQAGGNEPLEVPVSVNVTLPAAGKSLLTGKSYPKGAAQLEIDPWKPEVLLLEP
jgi:hypothetical protein